MRRNFQRSQDVASKRLIYNHDMQELWLSPCQLNFGSNMELPINDPPIVYAKIVVLMTPIAWSTPQSDGCTPEIQMMVAEHAQRGDSPGRLAVVRAS